MCQVHVGLTRVQYTYTIHIPNRRTLCRCLNVKSELDETLLSSPVCGSMPKKSETETPAPPSNTVSNLQDQQRALRLFEYDPYTGTLTWRISRGGISAGSKAGSSEKTGYALVPFKGRKVMTHRIIWLIHYGYWPKYIDHIDHNRKNNRLSNLREVLSKVEQGQNMKQSAANTSGVTGVKFCKQTGKWRATIRVNGNDIHLGRFRDFGKAVEARLNAEIEYDFHPNHGR
jgi:hypothetical protein